MIRYVLFWEDVGKSSLMEVCDKVGLCEGSTDVCSWKKSRTY